jgi:hypothetical protein
MKKFFKFIWEVMEETGRLRAERYMATQKSYWD